MAPNISRTRRRPVKAEAQEPFVSKDIFDAMDYARNGGQSDPKPDNKTREISVNDLIAQLNEVSARLDASERERSLEAMRPVTPAQPTQIDIGQPPTLNLEGLPDPVTQSKEYAATLAQRTIDYQNSMEAYNTRKTEATKPQSLGDPSALWDEFTEQFPEYAQNERQAKFAVQEVVAGLAKKGVDVQRYMFQRSDQFFKDVTGMIDDTFGNPNGDDELDDDGDDIEDSRRPAQVQARQRPRRRQARQRDMDEGDDGRTDGIDGGGNGGAPARGMPNKPTGIIEDLQAIQRKSGYF